MNTQQGDEADEAKHIGASQLIPRVRPTMRRLGARSGVLGLQCRGWE